MAYSRETIIAEREGFRVTSYGNGAAYLFENIEAKRDIFFQGDDATQFRDEWDAYEASARFAECALGQLWDDYSEASTPSGWSAV